MEPIYEYIKGQGWVAQIGVFASFQKTLCRISLTDKPIIGKYYDYWVRSDDLWDFENNKPIWDLVIQRYKTYKLGNDILRMTEKDYTYYESIGYLTDHRFWLVIEEVNG